MKPRRKPDPEEVPVVLEDGDRFLQIIASGTIPYEVEPDCESVITFFVVERSGGTFDVIQVMKTFRGKDCISRVVQKKSGIAADEIGREVADIERVFAAGIEKATGYRLEFHRLDLSGIWGRDAQVAAIAAWGRVGVKVGIGGRISLN